MRDGVFVLLSSLHWKKPIFQTIVAARLFIFICLVVVIGSSLLRFELYVHVHEASDSSHILAESESIYQIC